VYQGFLNADAVSAWLKVANTCLPNFEQMTDDISSLGESDAFTDLTGSKSQ
jgi:hypothetical protein